MPASGWSQVLHARVDLPPHRYDNAEVIAAVKRLIADTGRSPCSDGVIRRMFTNSGVRTRHTSLPLEQLGRRSFTQALTQQRQAVIEQSVTAIRSALDDLTIPPNQVDMLATTAYTTLTAPHVDVEIATALGLRTDVRRIGMPPAGCAGGAAMTGRMHDHLRGHPDHLAVGVVCDLPCFLLGTSPMTLTRIVETALFGDGCGVIVMAGAHRAGTHPTGPRILDTHSSFIPGTQHMVGWHVEDQGLRTFLEPGTAEAFEQAAPATVSSLLSPHSLNTTDIGAWICHPGSAKILQHVARGLGLDHDAFEVSYDVLARTGNMVGATVIHALHHVHTANPPTGTWGVLMAFGPGLSCELSLLRWP
ncbi:type III polyketide synthase [Actinomadura sp. 3N508]|uniref:type III polyketide synthase n=1 Tax=Actinomadura sp. 3N508 TaxID=3375153 RepID=UPI0037B9BDB6